MNTKKQTRINVVQGEKSSGFNIEDMHVTALDMLEKLFLLTMLAVIC